MLLAGFAMLVLPGPGIIVIILGLAILATEFAWAERRARQDVGPRVAGDGLDLELAHRTRRVGRERSGTA